MRQLPRNVKPVDAGEVEDALNRGRSLALLDVREPADYARAHLPGAANLPSGYVRERAERLVPDADAPLIVYGEDDHDERAVEAARQLVHLGLGEVHVLAGGAKRWASDDRRVEHGGFAPAAGADGAALGDSPEEQVVREQSGVVGGAGRTTGEAPEALAVDSARDEILVERRELVGGVAEHWRLGDGEHVVRFTPSGPGVPSETHVPGTQTGNPIGWFERSRN